MFPVERDLAAELRMRKERSLLRNLPASNKFIDFSSNDYLGFAKSGKLFETTSVYMAGMETKNGSGGSRLLSGNSAEAEQIEAYLADFHHAPAALLFNSGYDANVGLFSSVASKNDTVIYDEFIHASVRDGIRLSRAQSFPFRHNGMEHLKERIHLAKGNIFVAAESVYSMDGDFAPLKELTEICIRSKAHLIIDEAHATGVFHSGLVQQNRLEEHIFARVYTFGKALGCHGAVVTGSHILKQYLVNHARSFIYTTALPPHSLNSIRAAYKMLEQSDKTIKHLHGLIKYFRSMIKHQQVEKIAGGNLKWLDSASPIQGLVVQGNSNVLKMANSMMENNLDIKPILSPTVPKGSERLRICLHSYNTKDEIKSIFEVVEREKLKI